MPCKFPNALALLLLPGVLGAQPAAAPDTPDPVAADEIARATTESRFISPWVSYLPASPTVPSPRAFLHRIPGAPGELADTATTYAYCRALAAASPRVRVFTIGRSEEGRDIVLLAIADEKGIQDLARLKAATAALADPRKTDAAAAERIVAEARPIYYFNAGLHSDETGSTEAMLELAYRLAVSEQPMIRRIRENMIVLINPASNPDGRDKQVEWFYRYLKGKTDLATLPRQAPPYWSRYAFVDINRDATQLTHETTRAVQRMFFDWHPTIVHDLHESVALLITWNGTGPTNENVDPVTYDERLEMSFHEVTTLTGFGMPGVWSWNFGDDFAHLYLDSIALNHNSMGRGYETFGNGTAETLVQSSYPDEVSREWYRPSPPPDGSFRWSARDNLNYTETAALAALDLAAQQSKSLLNHFYLKGVNSWRKGMEEAPYAFLIPSDQGDPARVAQLVSLLLAQGIEVHRAAGTLTLREGTFPAGTYVVRLDQPYRNYAVDLLSPKFYPKDAGEPYDDISWELPANYHLTAIATADPHVREAALAPLTEPPHPQGRISGSGPFFLLKDTGQEGLLEAGFRLSRFKLSIAEQPFSQDGIDYPRGSWVLPAQPGLESALQDIAERLGIDFDTRRDRAEGADPPCALAPARHLGALGGYRHHRLGTLFAGSAAHPVHICQGRGHSQGRPAQPVRRAALRSRGSGIERTDTRPAEGMGTDAVQEDARDPEPRHTGRIRRHHGRHRLERSWRNTALRRERRSADHSRQRLDAAAGGRDRARRPSRSGRRAAQLHRRRRGRCGGGAADRNTNARLASAGHLHAAGSSDRLRLSGADACIPAELCVVLGAAPLAENGLLHHVSGRSVRCERGGHGMGRSRRRAAGGQRTGVGTGQFDRKARHLRHAGRQRPGDRVQFQPSAPGHESWRSETAVERHPQLAGDPVEAMSGRRQPHVFIEEHVSFIT